MNKTISSYPKITTYSSQYSLRNIRTTLISSPLHTDLTSLGCADKVAILKPTYPVPATVIFIMYGE